MNYILAFLVQVIIYAILWFISEYTGLLICMIMTAIAGGIVLFAFFAELIEKSKVPRAYFLYMITMFLAPLVVGIAFSLIYEGNFDWLRE